MDIENKTVELNEEEIKVAEKAAKNAPSTFTLNLKKPITYEEITAQTLEFDFESLTGSDSLAVERELQTMNLPVIVREINGDYLIRIACRACTQPVSVDFLMKLPIRAANNLMGAVRSFLMSAE